MSTKPYVAFIGTGVMGRSMAGHLMAAGHPLHVYNRTPRKGAPARRRGRPVARFGGRGGGRGRRGRSPCSGSPRTWRSTYLGAGGIVERAKPGALLIDMTTSSPLLARRIAADGRGQRGLDALDAPVSGGDIGAREARLVIMVGGAAAAFERAQPVFSRHGKEHRPPRARRLGPALQDGEPDCMRRGDGRLVSRRSPTRSAPGLDPARVHGEHQRRGGRQLGHDQSRAAGPCGDFAPGFYVKHIRKDIGIAIASAEEMSLDLPGLECARKLYDRVAGRGWEEFGTQILYRLYTEL